MSSVYRRDDIKWTWLANNKITFLHNYIRFWAETLDSLAEWLNDWLTDLLRRIVEKNAHFYRKPTKLNFLSLLNLIYLYKYIRARTSFKMTSSLFDSILWPFIILSLISWDVWSRLLGIVVRRIWASSQNKRILLSDSTKSYNDSSAKLI